MGFKKQYGKDGKSLNPTAVPSSHDVAFAAGYFEGEGYCGKVQKRNGLAVHVGQKDPEMLYKLRDWFGGSVRLYRRSGVNQVDMFVWLLSGDRARNFLSAIYPFLSNRRKQQIESCPGMDALISVETKREAPKRDDVIVRPAQECAEAGGNVLPMLKKA